MIKIIVLGKLKEQYLEDMINDYLKRLQKYHKCELIELKDENNLELEAKNIMRYISPNDYVITLEIEGHELSSEQLAFKIDKLFIDYSTITFIIGSSYGLSDTIKKRGNYALSFGHFTYPHGLFRGILLEQIYRAFKINNNEAYHK